MRNGTPAVGSMGLGADRVSGRIRVPMPPTSTTASTPGNASTDRGGRTRHHSGISPRGSPPAHGGDQPVGCMLRPGAAGRLRPCHGAAWRPQRVQRQKGGGSGSGGLCPTPALLPERSGRVKWWLGIGSVVVGPTGVRVPRGGREGDPAVGVLLDIPTGRMRLEPVVMPATGIQIVLASRTTTGPRRGWCDQDQRWPPAAGRSGTCSRRPRARTKSANPTGGM